MKQVRLVLVFVFINLSVLSFNVCAKEYDSIKPQKTTVSEIINLFGPPSEVVASFPWKEWDAKWKKRPISNSYKLRYRIQSSESKLINGPGGKSDTVEVFVVNDKVISVNWFYGGQAASTAAKALRSDPEIKISSLGEVSHGGKRLSHGVIFMKFGPNDKTLETRYTLK